MVLLVSVPVPDANHHSWSVLYPQGCWFRALRERFTGTPKTENKFHDVHPTDRPSVGGRWLGEVGFLGPDYHVPGATSLLG